MKRRQFLSTAAASLAAPLAQGQFTGRKPNIIFILADDLGYGDLGCYGSKEIRTPALDQLAAEGMRFTQAYAGSTVCAPSRCTLMTGLHTGHSHVRGNIEPQVPLRESDVTVAELLKRAGYRTGMFGKWGLGEPYSTVSPAARVSMNSSATSIRRTHTTTGPIRFGRIKHRSGCQATSADRTSSILTI